MSIRSLPRRHAIGLLGAGALHLPALSMAKAQSSGSVDDALLDRAVDRARGFEQLHSLIVSRGGEIAFAEAMRGPGLNALTNVKSVSKTLMAALTGVALERGVLRQVDQRIAPLLADSVPNSPDPRVRQITVEDLLTMRAGLERTSGRNYGAWVNSNNWVRDALRRPFVAEPGGRMLYSTGSYHLLSAALSQAAGRSTLALARDWLGAPLAIDIPPWTRDPQGIYMGGNNMALTPNALHRFGEMVRQGGVYRGERVLPQRWIEASWTPRTVSPWSGHGYGYGWFITASRGHPVYYARGYGGQMLYVVPEIGLTVAITSDANRPARSQGYAGALFRLLDELLIPAAA